ncbi:hypothetical protein [Actinoplanes sp. NPDC049802]|uniref:hypothetical protein n=1 Tax=Actinoplanes sp. NPDC049802 TaxID=3154742 RepID=UPI0033F37CC7
MSDGWRIPAVGSVFVIVALSLLIATGADGVREIDFKYNSVHTRARVDHVEQHADGPAWIVAFHHEGELITPWTTRLAGHPKRNDWVPIQVYERDPSMVASPGMALQDWDDLPGDLTGAGGFLLAGLLAFWWHDRRTRHLENPPPRQLRPRGDRAARRQARRQVRRRRGRR